MGDYNKDSAQDKFIDNLIQKFAGCSEQELLDEFETARNLDLPLGKMELLSDQFEVIWERIQVDRAEERKSAKRFHKKTIPTRLRHSKNKNGRFRWKRLAAVGVAACLMAGSGGMVAMGTKSYFYRESKNDVIGDGVVFNNDMNNLTINGEEEVYALIKKKLNIKPLKMGYMPGAMNFLGADIDEGYVHMEFSYGKDTFYLIQSKYDKTVSYKFDSDSYAKECTVYNKWLGENLDINKEVLEDGSIAYETSIIKDGASYSITGTMPKEVFEKIAEDLSF